MPASFKITLDGLFALQTSVQRRKFSDIAKNGMFVVARRWETRMLPTHFHGAAAARKYRYKRRAKGTLAQKKRGGRVQGLPIVGGERDDLVLTGQLKQQMIDRAGILRVFPTRFRLEKPAGRGPASNPLVVSEITRTTDGEQEELTRTLEDTVARQLNTIAARRISK